MLGTCLCEFDECAEFIFNNLIDQCPLGNAGPTCALTIYMDNSDDIENIFQGLASPDAPIDADVQELQRVLDKLIDTRYKAQEILTGEEQNATTLAPITTPGSNTSANDPSTTLPTTSIVETNTPVATAPPTTTMPPSIRRKRSYVPLSCTEVVSIISDVNDLVSFGLTENVYRIATIHRLCDYILSTPITHDDCEADQQDPLEIEIDTLISNTKKLHDHIQNMVIYQVAAEMDRIDNVLANYSAYLAEKEKENTAEFMARQKAEADLIEQAILARDYEPTTLAPYCICPQNVRKKRVVAETTVAPVETENATTSFENATTSSSENSTTTTPAGPPPTTWPNNCLCPDDGDDLEEDSANNGTNTTNDTSSDSFTNTTAFESTLSTFPDETTVPSTARRKRSFEEIEADDLQRQHHLEKRAIKYRCNTTIVLGVMFYDLYSKKGILANRCCCLNYPGELFLFSATIDEPWTNSLSDKRSSTWKDWKKMVDQEVRFLMNNRQYSELKKDELMRSIKFLGFRRTARGKVGVEFEIELSKPHWNNTAIIETAFENLIEIYRNQSETDKTVLGRTVLGRYTKRDYLIDAVGVTHKASR